MGIELLGKTNIDFIGKRKYSFILSAILVSLGIFSLVQMWRGQANLGIDFAGGTSVQLTFEKPFQLDKARHALEVNGFKDSELQQFTEGNKLLIKIKKSESPGSEGKVADRILAVFAKEFADNKFVVDSTTEIGPKVGKSLRSLICSRSIGPGSISKIARGQTSISAARATSSSARDRALRLATSARLAAIAS